MVKKSIINCYNLFCLSFSLLVIFIIFSPLFDSMFLYLIGQIAVFLYFLFDVQAAGMSVPPVWMPNNYFQTKAAVIQPQNGTFLTSTTPINKVITFTKAYTQIPQLAFAIKNYRGMDYLGTENFVLNRTNISTTGFGIYTMISGVTKIRLLNIVYLAVDRAFPYHLNVFNDIPANFSNGNLLNISGTQVGNRSYINKINYATLASTISSPYTAFGTNLTKNKVALYLCAIYNKGLSSTGKIKFQITATILNISFFQIKVDIWNGYQIDLLRFSIVAFDIADVQRSGLFTIVYQERILNAQIDNYISIPSQFGPATFIGLLDYTAPGYLYGLQFNWELITANNSVIINASKPHSASNAAGGLQEYRVVTFYVKTWDCPSPYIYFNLDTDMCDNYCAKYFYQNVTAQQCQPCFFACYQCANGASQPCTSCNAADQRQMVNGSCVCMAGFYENVGVNTTVCSSCSPTIPFCSQCQLNSSNVLNCFACSVNYALSGNTCVYCSIPNCLTSIIDNATCSCSICNPGFINDGIGGCVACTNTLGSQCIQCSSTLVCTECNVTNHYFLNNVTGLCQTCNNSNNFYLNLTTLQCEICNQTGCSQCETLTTCTLCDIGNIFFNEGMFYDKNTSTSQCYLCDPALNLFFNNLTQCQKCSIPGCTLCSSLTSCQLCDNSTNYFLDINDNLCYQCNLTQCLVCADLTDCLVCDNSYDYFLNGSNLCEACTIPQCIDCDTMSTCLVCNDSNNYYLNVSNGQCEECHLNQCIICNNLTTCQHCNQSNNYFINTATLQCQYCHQIGCLVCANLYSCQICDTANLHYKNHYSSDCFYCDPLFNMFPNTTSNECQNCSLVGCITCANLTACSVCNNSAEYYINPNDNLCYKCGLVGCLECLTFSVCKTCDNTNNYGLTPEGICKQCPFTCLCDGYVLPKYINPSDGVQYCSTRCGDGLVRNFQQCDDGNINSGDGCSSTCQIQPAWTCDLSLNNSCCTLQSSQITIQINKIIKLPDSNSMSLQLQIKPTLPIFTVQNLQNFLYLTVNGVPLYNERKKAIADQKIFVTYDYNQSIHGKTGQISIFLNLNQTLSPGCSINAQKTIDIVAQSNNNLPFMFYTEDDLAKKQQVEGTVNAAEIITYVLFIISMIPCKIIGLQLIGVLQLAYFSLAQQQNINILLQPFMKMKQINGLNLNIAEENEQIPDQIQVLGIRALFLNNCNLMLLLVVAQVTVAIALYFVSKFLQSFSKKLSSISKYLLKQGLLTLMMFNAFNIAFGVGIHFQYADKDHENYILSSIAAIFASCLIFATCLLLMFAESKQFGQFKNKLKPNLMCQLYFVFSLGYRYGLGYYIAVKAQYVLSSLVIIGFSFIFITYNLVNLPFKDAYHNYRANICHLSQLVILFVTNYYDSLTQNQPMQTKAYQFNAAQLQIIAIYISIGASAICLAVDTYKFLKPKVSKSKVANKYLKSSKKQRLPSTEFNNTLQDLEISNIDQIGTLFIESQLPSMKLNKK